MRWIAHDSGISWWLENDEGRTQGYIVKIEGQYLPCLTHNSKTNSLLRMDTLEAAQEHVLVWLVEKKLAGT